MNNHNSIKRQIIRIFFLLVYLTSACQPQPQTQNVELPEPLLSIVKTTPTPTTTFTPEPTMTATVNPRMTISPTLTPSPTPDPYIDFYMDTLISRKYGGGVLEDRGNFYSAGQFTRKLFKYRSEGLDLYGFINIPNGEGPFPIVVMLHGYVETEEYTTLGYSVRYADELAENGFIVVHPNLRGYEPSPDAENQLGIGDTIDTLNLIALIRSQSGSAGLLEKADAKHIGIWGHSMGGGILFRALIIDESIDAGLFYASIHPNEEFNLAHFIKDGRGREKIQAPPAALQKISPINYLERINVPVSIHHGGADTVVPPWWSDFLCEDFINLGSETDCFIYPDQPHTFKNSGDTEFVQNMIEFFNRTLK